MGTIHFTIEPEWRFNTLSAGRDVAHISLGLSKGFNLHSMSICGFDEMSSCSSTVLLEDYWVGEQVHGSRHGNIINGATLLNFDRFVFDPIIVKGAQSITLKVSRLNGLNYFKLVGQLFSKGSNRELLESMSVTLDSVLQGVV